MVSAAANERSRFAAMSTKRAFVPAARWSDPRHRRGLWGERVAMAYLTSCGWLIEAHRFRWGRHDLDVVARRGPLVAFVEVKTRGTSAFGAPAESVGRAKRRTLARAAESWRLRHGRRDDLYRFDVIAVRVECGGRYGVEHTPDAWRVERSERV
jgi:putative endonuclease